MATKRKCACTLQKKVQGKGRGGEKRGDVGDGEEQKKWRKRGGKKKKKKEGGGEKRRRRRRGRTKKMEKASESELGFERKRRDKQKDRDEDRRTEQVDKKNKKK
jgi:hypothetical protein